MPRKVRPSEAPETHACGQHGYDFGVACEFGGEEYDRDECEERRELVGEIRQEVDEIIANRCLERRFEKSVKFLVDIKHHGNGQDENDGENVGAEKLTDDISV